MSFFKRTHPSAPAPTEHELKTASLKDLAQHITRQVTFVDGPCAGGWVASLGPGKSDETEMFINEADGYAVYGWDGHFRRMRPVTDEDRAQWQRNVEYNRAIWKARRQCRRCYRSYDNHPDGQPCEGG